MAKSDVNGPNANDIFKILRMRSSLFNPEKGTAKEVPWNFSKFLVSADLKTIEFFNPRIETQVITQAIEAALKQDAVISSKSE